MCQSHDVYVFLKSCRDVGFQQTNTTGRLYNLQAEIEVEEARFLSLGSHLSAILVSPERILFLEIHGVHALTVGT